MKGVEKHGKTTPRKLGTYFFTRQVVELFMKWEYIHWRKVFLAEFFVPRRAEISWYWWANMVVKIQHISVQNTSPLMGLSIVLLLQQRAFHVKRPLRSHFLIITWSPIQKSIFKQYSKNLATYPWNNTLERNSSLFGVWGCWVMFQGYLGVLLEISLHPGQPQISMLQKQ